MIEHFVYKNKLLLKMDNTREFEVRTAHLPLAASIVGTAVAGAQNSM